MRPILALLLCLALATSMVAASFNVSAYLYDSESPSSVATASLAPESGVSYTLYTISGTPAILTANDEPMTDLNAISSVLRNDQTHTLLPSEDELSAIRSDIQQFNDSRNLKQGVDGSSYAYGLETTCLKYTLLEAYPCHDQPTCQTSAILSYNSLFVQGGYDAGQIEGPIVDYGVSVNTLKTEVPSILSTLDSLTLDEGASQMASVQSSITKLQSASQTIADSKLRKPSNPQSCLDCLVICPEANLDTTALGDASSKVQAIASRLSQSKSVQASALAIVQSTSDRVAYAQASALLSVWKPKWVQFKAQYANLSSRVQALVLVDKDANFSASAQAFDQLWAVMDSRISTRNLNNIDSDFARISTLPGILQPMLANGSIPYDLASAARNQANDALIQSRWSTLPSDTATVLAYNKLAARKAALDANFTPPLTTGQYNTLTSAYQALVSDAAAVRSPAASGDDVVSKVSERFSEQSVSGVFALTSAIVPLSTSTRSQVAPAIPPAVLLLSDLAIASLLLLAFIGMLLYFRPMFRSRAMLGIWMILLLVLLFGLGLGSVGLYMVMNQKASSGTLPDFERQIALSNTTFIAIDQAGAPSDALSAMGACAQNISNQLRARWNKTTSTFTYAGTACVWGNQSNLSAVQCFDRAVDHPVFALHYNATSSNPHFSTVYSQQADAYGDAGYYTRCEIGDVLN